MKKISFFILSIICIFFFSLNVKASETTADDLTNAIISYVYDNYGQIIICETTDQVNAFNSFSAFWLENPNYDFNLLRYESTNAYGQVTFQYKLYVSQSYTISSTYLAVNNYVSLEFNANSLSVYTYSRNIGQSNIGINQNWTVNELGNLDEFFQPLIDFDTIYYSPFIPTPNIEVAYSDFTSTNAPEVPLSVYIASTDSNIYSQYYIEMQVQFAPVTTVGVSYGGRSGGLTFNNASSRGFYVNYDIIKNSDLITYGGNDTTTSVLKQFMSDAWDRCLEDYAPSENLNFVYYQDLSNHLKEQAVTKYNAIRTKQCMFGNYMRVWVRYFTIDQENRYVVGAWKVWECYDSGTIPYDDTLPDYYEPYNTATGQTSTFTDTDANENQDIPTGQGTPTTQDNPNNNVTVINNVPNYPDYPTIASYNHDNILVQFIDTAKYLPTFFGDYSNFLVETFAFIPSAVWSVISLGFLASIVIMIIKVL